MSYLLCLIKFLNPLNSNYALLLLLLKRKHAAKGRNYLEAIVLDGIVRCGYDDSVNLRRAFVGYVDSEPPGDLIWEIRVTKERRSAWARNPDVPYLRPALLCFWRRVTCCSRSSKSKFNMINNLIMVSHPTFRRRACQA